MHQLFVHDDSFLLRKVNIDDETVAQKLEGRLGEVEDMMSVSTAVRVPSRTIKCQQTETQQDPEQGASQQRCSRATMAVAGARGRGARVCQKQGERLHWFR